MKLLSKLKEFISTTVESEPFDEIITVEQIHKEVDDLEEKSINAVKELLESIQIPTEDKVVNKAKLMESLGFGSNNETIKQGDSTKARIKEVTILKNTKEEELKLINEYRLAYPTDKIIPFSEFNKVLEKYKLIYAPSKAYIKDVPEKNLLEIKNSKYTKTEHNVEDKYLVTSIKMSYGTSDKTLEKIARHLENNVILLNPSRRYAKAKEYYYDEVSRDMKTREVDRLVLHVPEEYTAKDKIQKSMSNIITRSYDINSASFIRVDRTKLFIAAPSSHFDMESLSSNDGKEFFFKTKVEVTRQEIKDPIAFYMLKGANESDEVFVRIVSKWGTDDDKSYLDPIVVNENLN